MKTHRIIVIDPEQRTIIEQQSEATLDAIHDLVGTDVLCHVTMAAHYNRRGFDTGWLDDVGLSKGKPVHAFLLPISKDPMAGRCVIVGCDDRGETADAVLPVEVLRGDIEWLGLILPEVVWDHTEKGSRAIVTYSRVKTGAKS